MRTALFIIASFFVTGVHAQMRMEPYRLGITVKNVEKASGWYENNLGFSIYKKMEFPEYDSLKIYFLKRDGFEIELVEKKTSFSIKELRPDYNTNKAPLQGFAKLAFHVNDLKGLYEKVKRNGVKEILGLTYDQGSNVDFFIIEDVDGNMLQFIKERNAKRTSQTPARPKRSTKTKYPRANTTK